MWAYPSTFSISSASIPRATPFVKKIVIRHYFLSSFVKTEKAGSSILPLPSKPMFGLGAFMPFAERCPLTNMTFFLDEMILQRTG
jgi:hypothetical protein